MEHINTRGSEWRKWDLHIHSNASDGSGTPKEIVDEAIRKGLSVIALTDHHTVNNIDEIKEYAKDKNITVISGIEFRTEYGSKSVHIIGLFPDEYRGTILNQQNLYDLVLCPLDLSEARIKKVGEGSFSEGMSKVQVSFKQAYEAIHLYGGVLIAHAGSKQNSFDKEMKHVGTAPKNVETLYESLGTVKEELLNEYIDICEIRDAADSRDFYLKKYGRPSISASDAHKVAEIGSKFAWIKADTTFEGLRQILYEPKERVVIQEDAPDQKNDYQIIESITIKHDDFGEQHIPLHQNLNTIIGGRSSGKSILLGCIAKKVGHDDPVKETAEYNEYINSILSGVDVNWRDSEGDVERYIEYFSQSKISKLLSKNELNDIIKKNVIDVSELLQDIQDYEEFCIENKSEIIKLMSDYFRKQTEINQLIQLIREEGDKKGIIANINVLQTKCKEYQGLMSDEESSQLLDRFSGFSAQLIALEKQINDVKIQFGLVGGLSDVELFTDIENHVSGIDESIKKDIIDKYIALKAEFEAKWQFVVEDNKEALNKFAEAKTKEKEAIRENDDYKKGFEKFNENKRLADTTKQLKEQQEKVVKIENLEKQADSHRSKLKEIHTELIEKHKLYFYKTKELTDKIEINDDDVYFRANILFNHSKFQKYLETNFDLRTGEAKEFYTYEFQDSESYIYMINDLFNRTISNDLQLKTKGNHQTFLTSFLAENYFEINYNVHYQGDDFNAMSEGKKAFVVLRILLDFTKRECPILIDQPEDDLDNRAIYIDLVSYLKNKKKERQIILVTHNPNVVVGGDAEEVIVANQHGIGNENQDGIKFEYCSGSLENTYEQVHSKPILIAQGIKEHVCEILEGGDEAFMKRENKYGFKQS